jgi:hypothetical protein
MSTATTAISIGGPLYSGGSSVIDDLKASGFNQVFGWAGLTSSGDITYAGSTLVSQGKYIDTSGFQAQLEALKQAPTAVNNLQFMLGGWGSSIFPDIKALIFPSPGDYPDNPQIGSDTTLYQNFQALKNAIPIDGINFDDETLYDQPTTVAFGQLLNSLGYQVTYNPYTDTSFWVNCLYASDQLAPGLVSGFYLQCYAGGTGNDPEDWIEAVAKKMGSGFDAASVIRPGLWCRNGAGCADGQCPDSISQSFAGWVSDGIQYGWIWLWDDIHSCVDSGVCSGSMGSAAYAQAIVNGLSTT